MGSLSRHSFQALLALSCFSFSAFADNIFLRHECEAVAPVIVTYTTTVYATKEGTPNNPGITTKGTLYEPSVPADYVPASEAGYTHALSLNPYPIPIEHESCFNRSSTVEYAHSTYDRYYPSETPTSVPTKGSGYYDPSSYYKSNATSTTFFPTASGASSIISVSKNHTTPTSSASQNSTIPTPSCTPGIELDGATEHGYNKKGAPLSVRITGCSKFDVNQTTAFANFEAIPDIVVNEDSISFTGFSDDYCLLSVFALDTNGFPIIQSWELHFGTVNMPVLILNPDETPAEGVQIEANATVYPGLTGSCITDASGKCTIENLPGTTIGLVARKEDNSIAVNGLAPTTVEVTLKLLPFVDSKPGASFGVDNGTAGWTGGTVQQSLKVKRDTTLVVSTGGQYTIQTASNSFPASTGTKKVYIKYRFITSEVPGGFFGTQFNDYFSVTIRSDTGAYVTVTNSMNALGLGAFDSSGATNIFTLELNVPSNTKSIMFDVGVSNVADNLLDSSLVVESVGENKCDKCDTCENCPERPACQEDCRTPPPQSCNFYASCVEKEKNCGPSGYPIRYGQKNCLAFSRNLGFFTPQGRNFVWGTMSCLQRFLSPLIRNCDESCDSISTKAFASHPKCYTDNGFCGLGCGDILVLLAVVSKDLLESGTQIVDTAKICLSNALETLGGCAGDILVGTTAAVTFGASIPWSIAAAVAGRYLGGLTGAGS